VADEVPETTPEQEQDTTETGDANKPDELEGASDSEEAQETDIQSLEESAFLEGDADAEFEIISTEEAPIDLAEEYPQFQVSPPVDLY
jgi:hypothetical protein